MEGFDQVVEHTWLIPEVGTADGNLKAEVPNPFVPVVKRLVAGPRNCLVSGIHECGDFREVRDEWH